MRPPASLPRLPSTVPLLVALGLGALGLWWSDWFLLAGAVGALATAAWLATDPTNA